MPCRLGLVTGRQPTPFGTGGAAEGFSKPLMLMMTVGNYEEREMVEEARKGKI